MPNASTTSLLDRAAAAAFGVLKRLAAEPFRSGAVLPKVGGDPKNCRPLRSAQQSEDQMRRSIAVVAVSLVFDGLPATAAFAAPNPSGTGQPNQDCEALGVGRAGFNTGGFANAQSHYADPSILPPRRTATPCRSTTSPASSKQAIPKSCLARREPARPCRIGCGRVGRGRAAGDPLPHDMGKAKAPWADVVGEIVPAPPRGSE